MKIDILCTDGSPLHVCPNCIWGDNYRVGLGGSELYLMTLCEAWTKQGHQVRLYNDPHSRNAIFEQCDVHTFNPDEERDVIINFRTPNFRVSVSRGLKVWLSCDQYSRGDYAAFAPQVDKIVCISPHHVEYFNQHYGIENAVYIDIPMREEDFIEQEKIKNRLIFTSVPDRGLQNLLRIYPKLLQEIPDLSLVITSDYRLWGVSAQNENHRRSWLSYRDSVKFVGALPRRSYLDYLSQSELMVYPCSYEELFCISVAEAQWAGVYTITSDKGALKTTNMGLVIPHNPDNPSYDRDFIDATLALLRAREGLESLQLNVRCKARERFSLHKIMKEWDERVFK